MASPGPSAWERPTGLAASRGNARFLQMDGLRVKYIGPGSTDKDAASVRSDRPAPLGCGLYYWEVAILARGRDGFIGVGLAGPDVKLERLPGWDAGSFGYHGDDGHAFRGSGAGRPYGPTFGAGDVVGVLLNRAERTVAFTKNGVYLGVAFSDVPVDGPLHPTVGMRTPDEEVEGNFGGAPWRGADVAALVAEAAGRAAARVMGGGGGGGSGGGPALPPLPAWAPGEAPPPLAALAAAAAAAGGADRAGATAAALALDYCRHVGAGRAAAALAGALAAGAAGPAAAAAAAPKTAAPVAAIAAALAAAAEDAADPSAGPRAAVRAALEGGDVAAARAAAEALAPGALASAPAVAFALDVQAFVELVRAGDDGGAMEYGRTVLAPALQNGGGGGVGGGGGGGGPPRQPCHHHHPLDAPSRDLLQDALSLLAYADPAASPCGRLLSESARAALADALDGVLRAAAGLPPAPALEVALRQAGAAWGELRGVGDADAALVSPGGLLGLGGGSGGGRA